MAISFFQLDQQLESHKKMEAMLQQMIPDNKEFFSRFEAQKQPQAIQSQAIFLTQLLKQNLCIVYKQLSNCKQQKRNQLSTCSAIPIIIIFFDNYANNASVPDNSISVAVSKVLKAGMRKNYITKSHIQRQLCLYSSENL